jgi:hypothetical protein
MKPATNIQTITLHERCAARLHRQGQAEPVAREKPDPFRRAVEATLAPAPAATRRVYLWGGL